ncbi:MAG: NAD-dependent epimerase/dehydratase family protein [Candidatus Omnitrophota bacterium]
MSVVVVTGSAGLIGAEAVRFFSHRGFKVVGIDNDMRRYFFGDEGSSKVNLERIEERCPGFVNYDIDIRDIHAIEKIFQEYSNDIVLVIHCAAQPSHDWAVREPLTDFTVNAVATMNLLEAVRHHCPGAVFILTSTNKVYGDNVNRLSFIERETRWELAEGHPYFAKGINEGMSLDQCMHSLFGVSKLAGDILAQEYGRYFGIKTGVFRAGCLTGYGHAGVEGHGFLAYLMKCTVQGRQYRIFGYKGKQVRDNIHSHDLVTAFDYFFRAPRPGEVYNIGGSRFSHCSLLEAVAMAEKIAGKRLDTVLLDTPRRGDHIWWVSDVSKFASHYPSWQLTYGVDDILIEMHEKNAARWGMMAA